MPMNNKGSISGQTNFRRSAIGLWFFLALSVPSGFAGALSASEDLNGLSVAVYAPDWTWQKQNINILAVVINNTPAGQTMRLDLVFPQGKEDHFAYSGPGTIEFEVPAGKTVRGAFTNILARDGVPRQLYNLELRIHTAGQEKVIPYPVQTIRGAAVNPGLWAALLPAGLAAAWCIVFLFALVRLAAPGAWKTPGDPIETPEGFEL